MSKTLENANPEHILKMASDRIWPLVARFGVHSDPVRRALRSWGAIWEGLSEPVEDPEPDLMALVEATGEQ